VTIHFRGGNIPAAIGTVIPPPKPADEEPTSVVAFRPRVRNWYGEEAAVTPTQRFLVLETSRGRTYLDPAQIAYIETEGPPPVPKQRRAVLLLTARDTDKPATVHINYLARGIAWAPSYRVDITDPKMLTLEQSAVVRNELTPIQDAEIQLISGFPSVQFGNVTSPLAASTSWTNFFQELNRRSEDYSGIASNSMVRQQVISNPSSSAVGLDVSARPTGDGVDLHYQSIGKRTLGMSEALSLNLARKEAAYERIVEWLVADTRNEDGRYGGRRDDDDGQDAAWDALRFKNPFDFPMTTGPAMVVAKGRFNGQRTSYWVNPGEETLLRVNKALSIRTRSTEHEEQFKDVPARDYIYIGGRNYRRTMVKGELLISNHRKEDVKVVLRRRFSGELLTADENPKVSLREEGVWSVNKRNEMVWTLTFKPGEERTLTYRYSVLVAH
jgi:hypothetical protein